MKPMQSIEERDAQATFLAARERYVSAKVEFNNAQLGAWQLQIARDHYIASIEKFALACGVLSERDFSSLGSDAGPL